MKIFLTGPLKDLANTDVVNVQYSRDTEQLIKEISMALPDTQKIPFRISVNGQIVETQSLVKEDDRVELITLLQGG